MFVSSLNAADKTPLTDFCVWGFVFGVLCLGLEVGVLGWGNTLYLVLGLLGVGILALAFCHGIYHFISRLTLHVP